MPKILDRFIGHLTHEYEAMGKTPEEAKEIAWATATKHGLVERKGEREHLTEKGKEELEHHEE